METVSPPTPQSTLDSQPLLNNPPTAPNRNSKVIYILGTLIILSIVGALSYWLGTHNRPSETTQTNNSITSSPPSPTNLRTISSSPISPTITTTQPITIPANWKSHTAADPEYGFQTTMSLPPEFSFRFSGSEFTVADQNFNESWDYSTSIFNGKDGTKNYYAGESRRTWYQDYLGKKFTSDTALVSKKIIAVTEIPVGNTSYLKLTIEEPAYDVNGQTYNTRQVNHYLYVQNNILHIIYPVSEPASTPAAKLHQHFGPIFTSLTSQITS